MPFATAEPWAAVATMLTPVGAKPLNTQLARSSVVGVLSGTDIAHALGAGIPIVNCTMRLPGPTTLVAVNVAEKVPGVAGVPEITPVAGLTVRPFGKPLAA